MSENFKWIELGRDLRAKVSLQDYDRVSEHKWHPQFMKGESDLIYAKANVWKLNSAGIRYRTTMFMHRFITGVVDFLLVDHDDNDGLNNQRPNLIACGNRYNQINRRPTGVSGFHGVSFYKGAWQAQITDLRVKPSKAIYIGRFKTAEEAARAYDRRALELYGPYFPLNFPLDDYPEFAHAVLTASVVDPTSSIPF